MASIYTRRDSKELWLSCYPKSGKLVRTTLGTEDRRTAERTLRKVELLLELERLRDVPVPDKILCELEGLPGSKSVEPPPPKDTGENLRAALRAYVTRSAAANVHASLNNKLSQLRQFFGGELVDSIDPRSAEHRRHARRREPGEPWFKGTSLAEITPDTLLTFLHERNYGRSSKRHYRELFHDLFRVALVNGLYVPANPYAPNPASELPCYKGTDEPIAVLNADDIARQYAAVAANPKILFGCQVMIESGLRLHECLSLRRPSIAEDFSHLRLLRPRPASSRGTKLKTGERTVTVRPELAAHLRRYLAAVDTDWLIPSPSGQAWNSNTFGDTLRQLNRAAGLTWTTQDFRHTFATNRIAEGWNLKTLADEMGTSIQMLMEHYAGRIAPPVQAALAAQPVTSASPTPGAVG
jgi:integrase